MKTMNLDVSVRDRAKKILKDKRLYKGRKPNEKVNLEIIKLRKKGLSISETAKGAKCSIAQVKKIWREYNDQLSEDD